MKKMLNSAGVILLFVAIYNLALRLVGIVATPIYRSQGWIEQSQKVVIDNSFELSNVILYIIAIALTAASYLAIFKYRKEKIIPYCDLNKFNLKHVGIAAVFGFALNTVVMFVMISLKGQNAMGSIYAEYTSSIESSSLLLMLLMVAVLIPVFEEIIYRGLVFNELRKGINFVFAAILQALIFVVLELIVGGANFFAIETVYGFALSILFAFFYVWTGSLWTPIFARAFKNSASLIIVGLIPEESFVKFGPIIVAICAVLMVGSVVLLKKEGKRYYENKFANAANSKPVQVQ